MKNETREFGLFIDGLRLERGYSREELCEGIMSLSQYKRYLRGDTSIPNSKLVAIADRLKFSITDLHTLFTVKHNNEYTKLLGIYELIKSDKFKEAHEEILKLRNDVIVSEYNNLFYDFCSLRVQHALKMVSDVHVLGLYSKLINYPQNTENMSFNMVEITVLVEIVRISAQIDNYEPLNIMYRLLNSKNFQYTSASDSAFLPSIYSSISSLLGAQKEFDKVVDITNRGIEYCLHHESLNALTQLYFFNGLAKNYLSQKQEGIESMKKCFMLLYIEENFIKLENYKKTFEKQFKMNLSEIIDI